MKSIIIISEKNSSGKYTLTQDELEKIVTDAYNAGLEDGKSLNNSTIINGYETTDKLTTTPGQDNSTNSTIVKEQNSKRINNAYTEGLVNDKVLFC